LPEREHRGLRVARARQKLSREKTPFGDGHRLEQRGQRRLRSTADGAVEIGEPPRQRGIAWRSLEQTKVAVARLVQPARGKRVIRRLCQLAELDFTHHVRSKSGRRERAVADGAKAESIRLEQPPPEIARVRHPSADRWQDLPANQGRGVGEGVERPEARARVADDGVHRAQRRREGRRAEPHGTRAGDDETHVSFARRPQHIECERRRALDQPDHDTARDGRQGHGGGGGGDGAPHAGRHRRRHLIAPSRERQVLERPAAMSKPRDASGQIDGKAQPDERDRQLLDL
jgi:hypothetical protein